VGTTLAPDAVPSILMRNVLPGAALATGTQANPIAFRSAGL
jgi:hypothetical protein